MLRVMAVFAVLALFVLPFAACTSGSTAASTEETEPAEPEMTQEEIRMELIKSYNFGQQYYQQKNYQQALPYLHTAKEYDKQLNGTQILYPGLYSKIGLCYTELSNPDSALAIFEEGLQFVPEDLYMNEMVVYYYKAANRIDEFIPAAVKFLGLTDDNATKIDYSQQLKEVYVQRNEYELALEMLDKLVELQPDNKSFGDERLSILRLARGEGALRQEYEAKHAEFPNDTNYMLELISIYERDEEHQPLIDMVDKLVAINTGEIISREKKASALIKLGKGREAIAVYDELAGIDAESPKYYALIAEIYNDLGQFRNAYNQGSRAVQRDASFGNGHFQMAMAIMYQADAVRDQRDNIAFEDKLVYEKAVERFTRARSDFNVSSQAERWINHLSANYVPTQSDKFMNKGVTKPSHSSYSWLMGLFR